MSRTIMLALCVLVPSLTRSEEMFVKKEQANLRATPSIMGAYLGGLVFGDFVFVDGSEGDWLRATRRDGDSTGFIHESLLMTRAEFVEILKQRENLPAHLLWVVFAHHLDREELSDAIQIFQQLSREPHALELYDREMVKNSYPVEAWLALVSYLWQEFPSEKPGGGERRRLLRLIDGSVDHIEDGTTRALMLYMKAQLLSGAAEFDDALEVCARIVRELPQISWANNGNRRFLGAYYDIERVVDLAHALGVIGQADHGEITRAFEGYRESAEDAVSRDLFQRILSDWESSWMWHSVGRSERGGMR